MIHEWWVHLRSPLASESPAPHYIVYLNMNGIYLVPDPQFIVLRSNPVKPMNSLPGMNERRLEVSANKDHRNIPSPARHLIYSSRIVLSLVILLYILLRIGEYYQTILSIPLINDCSRLTSASPFYSQIRKIYIVIIIPEKKDWWMRFPIISLGQILMMRYEVGIYAILSSSSVEWMQSDSMMQILSHCHWGTWAGIYLYIHSKWKWHFESWWGTVEDMYSRCRWQSKWYAAVLLIS